MFPNIKRIIPEFITEYLVFCDCFTDINKRKTYLVLTRNLKLFEFYQKQLMSSIDLNKTCLNKHKEDLENYEGPKDRWYENSTADDIENNISGRAMEYTKKPITFGKYVFYAINIYKIYILIRCWDKCVVLKRLPDFKGYEIRTEYESVLSYEIIHGYIKFCPVVEFKFRNNEVLKTDFEDIPAANNNQYDLNNTKSEFKQLLDRICSTKTELQLHKSITARSFHTLQNNLTMGVPYLRSIKLEEKQMLNRCGDIWKRFTVYDDLVIGIPLVNQCSSPNLNVIRNVTPVLQPNISLEKTIQLEFRLFQLKLKFDQLDALETYLETEDENLQNYMWCSNGDINVLPESFVVLLLKLKISEVIFLEESPLFLNYDVINSMSTTPDVTDQNCAMPLQLYLQTLNFYKLLFEERSKYEITFVPETLHQDFLTIAMTSQETNLKITFNTYKDLEIIESYIEEKLGFSKPTPAIDHYKVNKNFHRIFYNKQPNSLWFGSLILRKKEITEDNEQYVTTWKIYCYNLNKTFLLVKTFLNDLFTIHCNILNISSINEITKTSNCIANFENILRQELLGIQKFLNESKNKRCSQKYLQLLENLYQTQMNTDILAKDILDTN